MGQQNQNLLFVFRMMVQALRCQDGNGSDLDVNLVDQFESEGYSIESYDAWFEISDIISGGVYDILSSSEQAQSDQTAADMQRKIRSAIIEKK